MYRLNRMTKLNDSFKNRTEHSERHMPRCQETSDDVQESMNHFFNQLVETNCSKDPIHGNESLTPRRCFQFQTQWWWLCLHRGGSLKISSGLLCGILMLKNMHVSKGQDLLQLR